MIRGLSTCPVCFVEERADAVFPDGAPSNRRWDAWPAQRRKSECFLCFGWSLSFLSGATRSGQGFCRFLAPSGLGLQFVVMVPVPVLDSSSDKFAGDDCRSRRPPGRICEAPKVQAPRFRRSRRLETEANSMINIPPGVAGIGPAPSLVSRAMQEEVPSP